MNTVNILEKFEKFNETWTPKIIGELNGQYVKLAKIENEFVWHSHEDEDELFMVFKGTLHMHFRDKTEVVKKGELIVVPRGVEHNPRTEGGEEVWVLLFEPKATKHTGVIEHERTVKDQNWI
ncbi:cupin domain-containing protein [Fulvivirga sp. M361]|uniref:cupin domain-containing protein n=1 Tax=Fulvivirga sp. M361 TaxID=2594266 RepID=UPI001179D863|nr:cupin domain-containing protein [Fulvivirga sp. M361]TRX59547.1 cupin domain-containing protein [Fulvivirga sp. M361]